MLLVLIIIENHCTVCFPSGTVGLRSDKSDLSFLGDHPLKQNETSSTSIPPGWTWKSDGVSLSPILLISQIPVADHILPVDCVKVSLFIKYHSAADEL